MTNLSDGYYKATLPESTPVLGEVKGGRFESHVWSGSVSYMLEVGWFFTRLVPAYEVEKAWTEYQGCYCSGLAYDVSQYRWDNSRAKRVVEGTR